MVLSQAQGRVRLKIKIQIRRGGKDMKTIVFLAPVFLAAIFTFSSPAESEDRSEFIEYEKIVLSSLSDPMDSSVPNWRELYLAKIAKYEAYLRKYPRSPLVAEVKLRIAELSLDVERPGIYELRAEMYKCLADSSGKGVESAARKKECIDKYYERTKRWRDPEYTARAVRILAELVEKHGYAQRYEMQEPRIGGFDWSEEQIGARALYMLSQGTEPQVRRKLLRAILEKYKTGAKLYKQIGQDLEKLSGSGR